MIITRKVLKLEDYITIEHIESMNKIILLTGSIVGVAYLTELFIAWYSGYIYEQFAFINRVKGIYFWSYIGMMSCNVSFTADILVQEDEKVHFCDFLNVNISSISECGLNDL